MLFLPSNIPEVLIEASQGNFSGKLLRRFLGVVHLAVWFYFCLAK